MTKYLKFNSQQEAIDALTAEGYTFSEYFDMCSGNGWGWMGLIPVTVAEGEPAQFVDGFHVNLNDCEVLAESLLVFEVATPNTPYNVVAL